jgi:hydrogenase assembly chaperone HypC/HupF
MCLAVPLEILRLLEGSRAVVKQGSGELEVDVSLLEDPAPGDFVLVHAGFAIDTIDLAEANKRIEMLNGLMDAAG